MFLIWLIPVVVILTFLLIIIIRAALFTSKKSDESKPAGEEIEVDGQRAVKNLQALVQCQTISPVTYEVSSKYEKYFEEFRNLLPELYPLVHLICTFERVGHGGLLFCWKGKASDKPTVFMSHYDVVPAEEEKWQKPPFSGIREKIELDSQSEQSPQSAQSPQGEQIDQNSLWEIWGRGTLDTKGTLCAILEAAETMIAKGFTPEQDIYFSFGGDEELLSNDAPGIVNLLKLRGIKPALVLDEGGAVVENVFPGVKGPIALIGTGEKGKLNVTYSISGMGGHASAPPVKTPIDELARAVVKINKHPFKAHICKPARQMFDILGRRSTFAYKIIFANLWCFRGVFTLICKKSGGELNALVRTTNAFTQMKGSPANNVIPPSASVTANMRLMNPDTEISVIKQLKEIINNKNIKITCDNGVDPSPFSTTEVEGYERVCKTISTIWPDAVISPYLMIAASDSRHFCEISDAVYRFSAMRMSSDDRKRIHGHNERIGEDKFLEAVMFYQKIISLS